MIFEGSQVKERDRSKDFEKYAKRVSKGEILTSPTLLSKEQRRLYIRNTLKEDHRHRVKNKPEEATQKFDKIASSLYNFSAVPHCYSTGIMPVLIHTCLLYSRSVMCILKILG